VSAIYPVSKQTLQRILPKHGLARLSIGLLRQIRRQLAVDEYVVGHEENCPQAAPIDDGLATLPMNADVPWDRRSSDFFCAPREPPKIKNATAARERMRAAARSFRNAARLAALARYFTSWSMPPW
jgi:hypothetical protein